MFVLLFLLLLTICSALPNGSGAMMVSTDQSDYSTDSVIKIMFSEDSTMPIPADDTMLQLVVRQCDAKLASSCSEQKYRDWKTQPFATVSKTDGMAMLTIDTAWPTQSYYISLESTKYGKTSLGQGDQPYIYGMSSRFQVTYTKGNIYLINPTETTSWQFDKEQKIEWRTDGMPGGETIAAKVTKTNMEKIDVGAATQTAEGGTMMITPTSDWGEGGITLRIFLAQNEAIFDEVVFRVTAPEAYYAITEPNAMSSWRGGAMVAIRWTANHIPDGTTCVVTAREPTNGDTFMITAQPVSSSVGMVMWVVPNTIQYTSNGWQIDIRDNRVTSYSAKFQIASTVPPGDCSIMKLKKEMNIYDQMFCTKTPFLITTGTVRIVSLNVEWLWCIDDRLRITAQILATGGMRSVVSSLKIGANPTRTFQVLYAAEHGTNFAIQLTNIRREDLTGKKALIADVTMFTYDVANMPNGPAGVPLRTGMRLETTDPLCKCPYEDPTAPSCVAITPPCIDPMDPKCDTPCVPNDTRAKCLDIKLPRDSLYAVNAQVCSAGLQVDVHSTPCQMGDMLIFSVKRTSTVMTVLNKKELPGCDLYWLNIRTTQGTGYVISSLVKACPPPRATTKPISSASQQTSSILLFVVVLLIAAFV